MKVLFFFLFGACCDLSAVTEQAIEKGNQDIARIHAENAIRQKTQSLNFLRMASRMDAICQRMQSAQNMKTVRCRSFTPPILLTH